MDNHNLVQPYDKECMKMAMLKHEETFKEQVYELHRLYQIQKMLMKNMHNNNHQENNISFNHNHHVITETINDQEFEEDECEIELTLGPTSFNRRRNNNMTNYNPESSDSVPSFSSSSTGSSHIKRKIERNSRITRENSGFLNSNRRNKQSPWMYQVLSLNMSS